MVCACVVFLIKHEGRVTMCERLAGDTVGDLTSISTTAAYSHMPSHLDCTLLGSSFV